jgi:glycosyltransferase involved in cell wall biosynthesis
MPAVSVVMNCHNGERYLDAALDSVYAQSFGDWEIVFWDNASTDASAAIARRRDSHRRYFRSERKTTLGAARNGALAQCRGEFIAFLDADDLWSPEKLARQVPLFRDAEVGLVFANCVMFDTEGGEHRQFRSADDFAVGRCFDALLARYFLAIPTVVLRRAALGPGPAWIDETFEVSEEVDLFLRIAHDWKLAIADEPLARYRIHAGSETWRKSERFLQEALAMLGKYRRMYANFDVSHGAAAARFEDRARYAGAVFHWREGSGAQARAQLAMIRQLTARGRLLWAASYIPFGLVYPILRRMGKQVPR